MIEQASYVALAASFVLLGFVAYWARPSVLHETARLSRERLVAGLPIGTFVIVGVNLSFFFVAQRAYTGDVLTAPYLSWSYGYPTGFLASPVAHANVSHITGNLVAALVFAPVAEYVVGHKLDLRGGSVRRPLLRALVGVPLAWYAVGVFLSVFSWGPSLGFSGVVYFLFGFVVVFYPVVSVGLLVVTDALGVLVGALRSPLSVRSAGETFVTPSWANIALDGHVLGLLVGVTAAALLARRRRTNVDGYRVGAAVLVLGLAQGLYAVWTMDGSSYVLYRAVGVALVASLALLVGYAVHVESSAVPLLSVEDFSTRRLVSFLSLAAPVLLLCTVGFVTGFGAVSTVDEVQSVEVGDYSVWYGEEVENERVVSIPFIDVAPVNFTVSGVIVSSEGRGAWYRTASSSELRSDPSHSFLVGGLGWYKEVEVDRVGLTSSTGNSSYSVLVRAENETTAVYDSPPARTKTVLNGWSLNLTVKDGERSVTMSKNGEMRRVPLGNRTVTIEGVSLELNGTEVVASHDETTTVVGRLTGARQNDIR